MLYLLVKRKISNLEQPFPCRVQLAPFSHVPSVKRFWEGKTVTDVVRVQQTSHH